MSSDLKRVDAFIDPLWLLNNLLDRYKIIEVPTNSGWATSNLGSGGVGHYPFNIFVYTGTTANSRGLAYTIAWGLNSGDVRRDRIDFSKKLMISFAVVRRNSDSEAVARFQLKSVNTEGDLADLGLGIRIDNYTVLGEAYGTARGTTSLGSLTNEQLTRFKIVHVPDTRVEFWVDGVLTGVLTGTYVPTGLSNNSFLVASIVNGPTGGVDAQMRVFNIRLVQEW